MPVFFNKYHDLADEELVERIGQEDSEAFDELYRRYSRRLLYYLYRMLGGQEEKAQDFLQELFLKVLEKNTPFAASQRFSTWIFSVAHNMCCNEYRRLEVRGSTTGAELGLKVQKEQDGYHHAERSLDQKVFKQSLLCELARLDEDKRSTFLLRYQENCSIREISAILGCPIGTVKSRLFYTSRLLAARLRAFATCNEGGEQE